MKREGGLPVRSPFVSFPRLANGCDLLGRYESSAYTEPQYLVRRGDGQLICVSHLLYLLASHLDGKRDLVEIAQRVSAGLGRQVSPDNVGYLVQHKLQPIGLVCTGGPASAPLPRARPMLALRFRAKLLPERFHRTVTMALRPLFWPPVVVAALGALTALDSWLFTSRGAAIFQLTRQLIVHPLQFLLLTALVLASCIFHEFGHAAGARYGGARPGAIGVGIYLAFPVFYTDVTDSYRLTRRGRLRTDLGGVYFNALAVVALGCIYLGTGFEPLVVFVVVSQLQVLYQFLPTVRMDGYYVLSDLIGVPNLFAFVRPVLRQVMRGSDPAHARLDRLTRGARIAITIWVCLTVPILLINVGFFAVVAPRALPALWSAARHQEHLISSAIARGEMTKTVTDSISFIVLVATGAGLFLTGILILIRISRLASRSVRHRPTASLMTVTVGLLSAAVATLVIGVLQLAPTLVETSVVCCTLAALTLGSFLYARRRGGRSMPPVAHRCPIEHYETLRVADILPLLKGLDPGQLRLLRRYEERQRARKTVLARIDTMIDKSTRTCGGHRPRPPVPPK
jgi:putative peptide zinc metalloprotease protein